MTVKEKLKNGKDRVVKFVDDHKVGLAIFGTWAVTTAAMWIGRNYDVKNAYKLGQSTGWIKGSLTTTDKLLDCFVENTDLTEDDVENIMKEHGPDYGFRKLNTEE